MKQNSNEHIVMSIAKTANGIELQEDVSGTIPELTSLLTFYLVHFCQHFSRKEITKDGHKLTPNDLLMAIILTAQHNIDEELQEELQ